MKSTFRTLGQLFNCLSGRRDTTRRRKTARPSQLGMEALEERNLLSVAWQPLSPGPIMHSPVEAHAAQHSPIIEADHVGVIQAVRRVRTSRRPASLLPGKWRVEYDASALFGRGARAIQEYTFTGPLGPRTFVSTTAVVVNGFLGPVYYQYSSWGTYRFLNNRTLRLTITGGSPTEYLGTRIIPMGGQTVPIRFLNSNQILSQGQTFNRIPLNSGVL